GLAPHIPRAARAGVGGSSAGACPDAHPRSSPRRVACPRSPGRSVQADLNGAVSQNGASVLDLELPFGALGAEAGAAAGRVVAEAELAAGLVDAPGAAAGDRRGELLVGDLELIGLEPGRIALDVGRHGDGELHRGLVAVLEPARQLDRDRELELVARLDLLGALVAGDVLL